MDIRIGDIFNSGAETLVNTVNCVGVMGKGIALDFKKRYPEMYKDYTERCRAGIVKPGEPYYYSDSTGTSVINFPTKDHWRSPSRLSYIIKGLDWIAENYESMGLSSVAFPPLGCGNGGLSWSLVGPVMYSKLKDLPLDITVFAPFGTQQEELTFAYLEENINAGQEDVFGKKGIPFNKYWLLILYVVQALNRNRYALSVGRTIFQKVCYVLTRTGISTGFRFAEGSYGPYSPDVKEAIMALSNGNYMTEHQLGKMVETVVDPDFVLNKAQFTQAELECADATIDLMSRIKRTEQAEMIGTVLFAYDEVISEASAATEQDIFDRIHRWKNWWKDQKDQEIISTISDLSILGWIKPDRRAGILVPEDDLV